MVFLKHTRTDSPPFQRPVSNLFCSLSLSIAYCTAIVFCIASSTIASIPFSHVLLYCSIFVVLSYGITWNKTTMLVSAGMVAVGGILLFIGWYRLESSVVNRQLDILQRISMNIANGMFEREYASLFLIPLCFIWAFYTTVFIRKSFQFFALFLPSIAILIVELLVGIFQSPFSFYMLLITLVVLRAIRPGMVQDGNRKNKNVPAHSLCTIMLSAMPICLISVLLGIALASPFDTQPSERLSNWNMRAPWSSFTAKNRRFSLSDTGFQPNPARLGGNIRLNRNQTLSVTFDQKVSTPLYLAGARKHIYDGIMWSSVLSEFTPHVPGNDHLVLQSVAQQQFLARSFGKVNTARIQITPLDQSVHTLFFPLEVTSWWASTQLVEHNKIGDKIVPSTSDLPEIYESSFLDLTDDETTYLRKHFSLKSEMMQNDNSFQSTKTAFAWEDYEDYHRWVGNHFTEVSDTVTQRVIDLVTELTAHLDDDYEKLRAVEQYLQQIPYTLSPGRVPENHDFVDYFLFENREGYCTYYATAMCVMARLLGFPSRYVEGFAIPAVDSDTFIVTNEYAHAWSEIYFPELGWVTVDATPAAQTPFAVSSSQSDESSSVSASSSLSDDSLSISDDTISQQTADASGPISTKAGTLVWLLMAVCAILVLMLLVCWLQRYRHQRYLKRLLLSSDHVMMQGYICEMLRLITLNGHSRLPHETLPLFFDRIQADYPSIPFGDTGKLFEQVIYGHKALTQYERDLIRQAYDSVHQQSRTQLHVIPYWVQYILAFRPPTDASPTSISSSS